jgi:hypothetical protein
MINTRRIVTDTMLYQKVACALLLSGENLENYGAVENILVEMGTYFQVQVTLILAAHNSTNHFSATSIALILLFPCRMTIWTAMVTLNSLARLVHSCVAVNILSYGIVSLAMVI